MQFDLFPTDLHLRCIDPASNKRRFYVLSVQRTLFGDWVLVREGRIGRSGHRRQDHYPSAGPALDALQELARQKGGGATSSADSERHVPRVASAMISEGDIEIARDCVEPLVPGPQAGAGLEETGGEKCGVDESDAPRIEPAVLDHLTNFVRFGERTTRQAAKETENHGAVLQ